MSFLYPLGLLGLIGIPILIAIYIIKSKYTEQTIASTYLWTLSEKFLKRKNPISKLTGIISLILQLLAIAVISLAIAHPVFTISGLAKEYCFVLDCSGSMRAEREEQSRFDMAKGQIYSIIDSSVDGSAFTLILASDNTSYAFEQVTDKDYAKELIEKAEPAFGDVELSDSLLLAQKCFNNNPSVLTYLVTDKGYEAHNCVNIVDVSADENNCAISDVTYTLSSGTLTVSGNIAAYGEDSDVTLGVYIDGSSEAAVKGTFLAVAGEKSRFELSCEAESLSSLRVLIDNGDSLSYDNEYVIYDEKSDSTKSALIVSDSPFFVRASLMSIMNGRVDVLTPDEYAKAAPSGYGLYVFDACSPALMPTDGAIWIMNPKSDIQGSGFTVQGDITLEKADTVDLTKSSSTSAKALSLGLSDQDNIYITEYTKCGLYRSFTTLYSYNGNSIIFAGTNSGGNREVVFAFDLHTSNLPMLYEYMIIMRNLVAYSFPDVVESTNYTCGDTVVINPVANCSSIRVDSPMGKVSYLDMSGECLLLLTEAGTYRITMTVGDSERALSIYSAMPESESDMAAEGDSFSLFGTAFNKGYDGTYDPIVLLFVLLMLIIMADWGVYCYEKHQLR